VEGVHSIYIESWRSEGVVDVESTVPKSGLFYDLWDTRQDLVNFANGQFDNPSISWSTITNTGLGIAGTNTAPDRFTLWRNNLTGVAAIQSSAINNLFFYYGF
jgi:Zn-dependent membrane protease YugP